MNFSKLAIAMAVTLTSTAASAQEHLHSLDASQIDNAIPAGTDFYGHVNHKWQVANPLTPEHARYGKFNVLSDTSEVRIKNLVLGLAETNPQPGTVAFKVSTIYNQAMDSARRNAEGAAPIQADLKRIESTPHDGMEELLFWMHKSYANPFFNVGFQEDLANSSQYAMYVDGGGLGLGDRDYYLLNDQRNKEVREAYQKMIVKQLQNAGFKKKDAQRIMKNVIKIETAIADSTKTREESRDITAMYNPRTLQQLSEQYPSVNWAKYIPATMGFEAPRNYIVTSPKTMAQADKLLSTLTDREIKDFYLWKYVAQAAGKLGDNFTDAAFEFSKVMSGVEQQKPRWKRALGATEGAMGEAIGQLYVEK